MTLEMKAISMNELLYSYPDIDEMSAKEIQEMMYKKLEFSELETGTTTRRIRPGEYFPYQTLGQRYMFPYDRMLCIMEPGTGKTCFNIGIAEKVRMIQQWVDVTIQHRSNIKRCYVLTDSNLLVAEFNYQFICRCTDGRYMSEGIRSAGKSTGRTLQINSIVGEFYEPSTYYEFNSQVEKMTDEEIINRFSDCMFFLDEVHTFRNSDTGNKTTTDKMYSMIHHIVHTAKRIKLTLNTATPMVDNVSEIIPLINLIVPMDQQLDESHGIDDMNDDQYAELLKGKIMFVRSQPFRLNIIENGIDILVPKDDGSNITEVSTKVIPVLMSDNQTKLYYVDYGTRRYTDNSYLDTIYKSSFRSGDPNLDKVSDSRGQHNMQINEGFKDVLDNIYEYSAKYEYLLNYIETHDGTHYIYWNYLEGGLNIIAALLLSAGYERFTGIESPFKREVTTRRKPGISIMSEYCVSTNEEGENKFTSFSEDIFPKKPRFAILSGSNKDGHSKLIKETMIHPDNLDGDYIKILIVSPVGKLGINLNNISHVHTIGAHWNKGNEIQAEGRAIRSESHVDLYNRLVKEREYNLKHGIPLTPQQESLMVDIHINRYCAIPRYLDESYLRTQGLSYDDQSDELFEFLLDNISNPEIISFLRKDIPQLSTTDITRYPLSIDEYMYRLGVEKEINIRKMLRIMKRIAVDCNNNLERNVVKDGIDGSLECDYEICGYTCLYDPSIEDPNGELKGSIQDSYAALYLDKLIEKCREIINRSIFLKGYITWSDITSELNPNEGDIALRHKVYMRLTQEYDRVYTIDRNGKPAYYMVNQHGIWTIDYLSSKVNGTVLTDGRHGFLEKIPLARVLESFSSDTHEYTDKDLQDIINNAPDMTLINKLNILEKGILDNDPRVLEIFKHYIFNLPKKVLRSYRVGNVIEYESHDVPGERALIHIFPSDTKSSYIVSSLFMTISKPASKSRIYDVERKRWRNMNERDYKAYVDDMQKELDRRISDIDSNDIFAYTNIIDYRLRLINHKQHREARRGMKEDVRARSRGLLCLNWPIDLMAETLYDVDADEFMKNLLAQFKVHMNVSQTYRKQIDNYVSTNPELRPIRRYYNDITSKPDEFSWDGVIRYNLVTEELMMSLARIQYDAIEGRVNERFNDIYWDMKKLIFINLLMLSFVNSSGVCRCMNIQEIFERNNLLYRM